MNKLPKLLLTTLTAITLTLAGCGKPAKQIDERKLASTITSELQKALDATNDTIISLQAISSEASDTALQAGFTVTDSLMAARQVSPNIAINIEDDSFLERSDNDTVIGIVALTLIFGGPMIGVIWIVVALLRNNLRKAKLRNDLMAAAISNNYQIPPEFFMSDNHSARYTQIGFLRKGIIYCGVGLIISMAFLSIDFSFLAWVGLIPAIVGIGNIVSYVVATKAERADKNDSGNISRSDTTTNTVEIR